MSLDKAIKHGKEKRKQYYDSRAVDPYCRSHGACMWCQANRFHKIWIKEDKTSRDIEDWKKGRLE